ncbi:MAG: NAD(P)H-binding protein [Terriglobales bacterium]
MKITITTPSGNIGSKLADILLNSADAQVTVLARTPSKVEHLSARGARVVAGDQLDGAALDKAVDGADVLFWAVGMDYTAANVRARYNQFADAASGALCRHPQLRIVHVSSVGAQLPTGTGPIKGLYDAEQKLNAAGKNVIHLRANYFMENVLSSLPTIASDGAIYATTPGNVTAEQVATADIAEAAANYLLRGPHGHHVVDISGPENISFDEVAATVGEAIAKPVRHVQIPPDALKGALTSAGLTADLAAELVELQQAMADGRLREQVGDLRWKGKVTFAKFAQEVIKPAYRQSTAAA